MVISFNGENVRPITGTEVFKSSPDDLIATNNGEQTPIVRNGVGYNGSCLVEVEDGSVYSKTLSELLALHSPAGIGSYTVEVDGEVYSYQSLITVNMVGDLGQMVHIEWKGTINPNTA